MNSIGRLPQLLHVIPYAYLGGTEKDCLYFIESSKHDFNQSIWVLDKSGPMVEQWIAMGARVEVLDILGLSQREFIKQLSLHAANERFEGILYWSTIKLPLVRYAFRNQRCRMAVHAGNPANFRPMGILKQMVEHMFYPSPINTQLFACSNHVLRSLSIHPYYRQFGATTSYNPVRLLDQNPYRVRPIDQNSEIVLGMTARLDPIKDHQTLLMAFKKVLSNYPFARLWLIGDGVLRNILEKLAQQLGIFNNVVFWGNIENVYERLQQMDIFVYSTTFREGLGNALSEAMACGLPCIVSDLPMMHEVAGHDSTLLFFEPYNADELASKIFQLLANESLRHELSQKAFNRAVLAFDAKRYVKERINFLMAQNSNE
ncbi:MAG: glycosyltransferase [Bacteroidales bacterium]